MIATTTVVKPSSNMYHRSPTEPYYIQGNVTNTPPSNDASPTDLQSPIKVRQLRQPRQPLYIPAALRPTDVAGRPRGPDTPPASKESSFDSGNGFDFSRVRTGSDSEHSERRGGSGGAGDAAGDAQLRAAGLLGHVDSADGTGLFDFADELGAVTGAPTTAHWKPDESASACAVCNAAFTWFFRRHHCRRCGGLVCDAHLRHTVPLDQNARFHPAGTPSKACTPCWDAWKRVRRLHHSRAGSIAESSSSSQGTAVPIPGAAKPAADDVRVGSMARSEGMVWSTF